ncbi:MAG TPA: hypothetical protein VJ021_01950 [Thermoplasmata archaeon]|nr:hypothetical protein [Thermoplasmata archaeon]
MTLPGAILIERRALRGTSRSLSALTISVDPPAVAPPAADARIVALLRRAREHGVTNFDVARARFPERAETLIATAFPVPDPELSVIVGRSIESLARERPPEDEPTSGETLTKALEASVKQSRRRLRGTPISILEWDTEAGDSFEGREDSERLGPTSGTDPDLLWAVRVPAGGTVLPRTDHTPALFSGEFSLLEQGLASLFERTDPNMGTGIIARDPFSDGRLDGSRFAAVGTPGGPEDRPVDLRRLHREFEPILRLRFLTEGRRRTLAQAAVRFVLGWPWVVTCVIPLPTPERFEEILGYGSAPAISDEELTRLGLVK